VKAPSIRKKLIWSLAAVGGLTVALYGSACFCVGMNQTRFIFMPQREITPTPADIDLVFENVYLPVSAINLAVMHPDAGGLIVEGAFTSIADMGRQHQSYRF
jgi:hypothetical protein